MSTIISRRGDPSARAKAYKSLANVGSLKAEYNATTTEVARLEKILDEEKLKLSRTRDALDRTREELLEVEEEIDSDRLPEGAQPVKRIQRRDKLTLQTGQLTVAVAAQTKAVEAAVQAIAAAERKLFEADKNLNKFVDEIEEVEAAITVQASLDKDRSEKLASMEIERAKRWEKEQRVAMEVRSQQIHELSELATKQINTAKLSNKNAVKKARAALEQTKETVNKLAEYQKSVHDDRTNAILELKSNTAVVFNELAQDADKYRSKVKRNKEKLEGEKDTMIAKGLNPYVEFRRRQFAGEGKAREARMLDQVESNKSALSETLIKEEEIARKEEIQNRRERLYEKKYRDELGRHVVEERTRGYINDITADHVDILDPTGRAPRVDPSKITDIADFSFGLGKSARIPMENMKRITDNIRAKLQVSEDEVGEYDRLLSQYKDIRKTSTSADGKKKRKGKTVSFGGDIGTTGVAGDASVASIGGAEVDGSGSNTPVSSTMPVKSDPKLEKLLETKRQELSVLANQRGQMPGSDLATATVNLPQGEADLAKILKVAEEGIGDNVNAQGRSFDNEKGKYKTAVLTKYERDCFEAAKQQQTNRLTEGTEQVAGGRTFKGRGFVSKPEILEFKDFEVGQVYKKRFILTNASYTFNSFRLLNLTDDVIDFFEISFEKPGRVSAGVSCPLDIVFVPKTNKDIFTNLRFLTETGPVEIPIHCLIKRCAPVILNPDVDFGNVVIGQIVTIPLKIKNTEALPSSFTVERRDVPGKPLMEARSGRIMTLKDLPLEEMLATASTIMNTTKGAVSQQDILDGILKADPAASETELWSRVKRIMTSVLQQKKQENPFPLNIEPKTSVVDGYNETSVSVICAPLIVGTAQQDFVVTFHQVDESMQTVDGNNKLIKKQVDVSVEVVSDDVPIYVAEEVLDLNCTMFDRIYRTRVELKSRAKAAYRIDLKVPTPMNQYIEVNPAMLFVQAGGSQIINVKFTPTLKMLSDLKHMTMAHEQFTNAVKFAIPIEIKVVTQDLPLYFVLTGDVCQSTIDMSSHSLDYGKCYISQRTTMPLTIENTSMLAQKVGFVKVPKEISVEPNDGFATLLPKEKITFLIGFSPKTIVDYDFPLTMVTSSNDTYTVQIKGKGVELPLSFSVPVVKMRTTCPGERVLESCLIVNKTNTQQCCEVMQPDMRFSWLRISPLVVDLAPGASCRIDLEYSPPAGLITVHPEEWYDDVLEQVAASLSANGLVRTDVKAKALTEAGEGEDQEGAEGTEKIDNTAAAAITDVADAAVSAAMACSPFSEWEDDSGWRVGTGLYGKIQWSVPPTAAEMEAQREQLQRDLVRSASAKSEIETGGDNGEGDSDDEGKNDKEGGELLDAEGGEQGVDNSELEEGDEREGERREPADRSEPVLDEAGGGAEVDADALAQQAAAAALVLDDAEAALLGVTDEDNAEAAAARRAISFDYSNRPKNGPKVVVPAAEWGIISNWRIPVLFRPKQKAKGGHHLALSGTATSTSAASATNGSNNSNSNAHMAAPMFLCIQTAVMRPQIDCDVKFIDFGQMAIGKRTMRRIMIRNYTDHFVPLQSNPVNAVGPFFVMNAIRGIPAGEFRTLTIECWPKRPGLTVEILELFSPLGGHQVRVTLKTQGVEPVVELSGLTPPLDPTWSPLGGIMDFANVLAGDVVSSKFSIRNKSAFPIDAVITRTACDGLAPLKQISFTEKGTDGMPLFVIKPERVRIEPNDSTDIEIWFRPDRGRNKPFREDLNVFVGQTDGVIKICVTGRAWDRQMYVIPSNPLDEPFSKTTAAVTPPPAIMLLTDGDYEATTAAASSSSSSFSSGQPVIDSALLLEDIYSSHMDTSVRTKQKSVRDELGVAVRPYPCITLDYPDLFADGAKGYVEVDKGGKNEGRLPNRKLVRKLTIGCTKVTDNRPRSGANGTFEIVLSQRAKESGLFSLNTDKGSVAPGQEMIIEIGCTLAEPKGIGGLKVGSWQSYAADVFLRGGWCMDGEAEDTKIQVILKAFVRL